MQTARAKSIQKKKQTNSERAAKWQPQRIGSCHSETVSWNFPVLFVDFYRNIWHFDWIKGTKCYCVKWSVNKSNKKEKRHREAAVAAVAVATDIEHFTENGHEIDLRDFHLLI